LSKLVDIRNLTKFYNKKSKGVENLSFSIEEGEIFGFIGPNGAGKSTTIRLLLNFIYPTSGSAYIFGKDIVKHSKEIRHQVGYLPSEIHYYDDMKVEELLRYSAHFHQKLDNNRIKKLASRLDLDLTRKIEDLSFGNRKKVGIAQALIHEPKLLILDEPTSGLDPLMQNTFFEMLQEERDRGATIFFSSHVLSEVQKTCDRVAIIKEGSLIKVESVESLTHNKVKNISFTLDGDYDVDLQLGGISKQKRTENTITLLYAGEIQPLLEKLTQLPIEDISIEEPSLEEIFMHYYKK
jgi:ABC-2 type transport system ATP-binding protein